MKNIKNLCKKFCEFRPGAGITVKKTRQSAEGLKEKKVPTTKVKNEEKGAWETQKCKQ